MKNCKFLLAQYFKGTKAMIRGHEGNHLRCSHEVSGMPQSSTWYTILIGTCVLWLKVRTGRLLKFTTQVVSTSIKHTAQGMFPHTQNKNTIYFDNFIKNFLSPDAWNVSRHPKIKHNLFWQLYQEVPLSRCCCHGDEDYRNGQQKSWKQGRAVNFNSPDRILTRWNSEQEWC